ncbi:MAG: energy transducer TonB [Saprospiraceae bacterium]
MKNFINFVLLFFPIMLLAQSETTMDEYKYLTKGYAYQKEMGLDGTKEGYAVKKIFTASNGVEFRSLIRGNAEVKGVLVILNMNATSPVYLGLPTNNSSNELKRMAENDARRNLSLDDKEKYDHAILEFAMFQLDGGIATNYIGETEKNLKGNSTPSSIPNEKVVEEYSTIVPLSVGKKEQMTERSGAVVTDEKPINNNVLTKNNFKGRSLVQPPVVKGQNPKSGTVVIKMCIDIDGNVKTAKFTQRGSTTFDKRLRSMAVEAAKQAKFSKGLDPEECGSITFKFK